MIRTLQVMLMNIALLTMALPASVIDTRALQSNFTLSETASAWKTRNVEAINSVRTVIFSWAKSWQNKDFDSYMSYYSPSFRSGGIDYKRWRQRKAVIFNKPGAISLKVIDLSIVVEGSNASASFVQQYKGTNYSDVGEKFIDLIHTDGIWKIISEKWRRMP